MVSCVALRTGNAAASVVSSSFLNASCLGLQVSTQVQHPVPGCHAGVSIHPNQVALRLVRKALDAVKRRNGKLFHSEAIRSAPGCSSARLEGTGCRLALYCEQPEQRWASLHQVALRLDREALECPEVGSSQCCNLSLCGHSICTWLLLRV